MASFDDQILTILLWRFPALDDDALADVISGLEAPDRSRASEKYLSRLIGRLDPVWHEEILAEAPDMKSPNQIDALRVYIQNAALEAGRLVSLEGRVLKREFDSVEAERLELLKDVESDFDREAFFSEPSANAELDIWQNYPTWTFEEALALSFGKEPTIVNRHSMRRYKKRRSLFGRSFWRRADLLQRGIESGAIKFPLKPAAFSEWANAHGISETDGNVTLRDRTIATRSNIQGKISAEVRRLNNLYILIAAIAVDKYAYFPENIRNSAPKLMEGALDRVGMKLSHETILEYIKEGIKRIDADKE